MKLRKGDTIEGKITGITKYGAFVEIDSENSGMIHISEISSEFVRDINELLKLDQAVKAVVIGTNDNGKLALSIKQLPKNKGPEHEAREVRKTDEARPPRDFEDMVSKFMRDSEEKISEIKFLEPKKSGNQRRRKD